MLIRLTSFLDVEEPNEEANFNFEANRYIAVNGQGVQREREREIDAFSFCFLPVRV